MNNVKIYSHHQQQAGHRWPPPCSCSCCYSGTAMGDKKHNQLSSVKITSSVTRALPFIMDTCHSDRLSHLALNVYTLG